MERFVFGFWFFFGNSLDYLLPAICHHIQSDQSDSFPASSPTLKFPIGATCLACCATLRSAGLNGALGSEVETCF